MRMPRELTDINNAGDTIIEVLIAIAVVSLLISGAYVLSNRSSKGIRMSQEHGEALKYAEAQLEQTKAAIENSGASSLPAVPFCFISGTATTVSGTNCDTSTPVPYSQAVTTPSVNDYKVTITWPGVIQTQDSVELDYRAQ